MYLEQFRMINDALDFGFELPGGQFSGYKINFGVYFEINADRRFNKSDVKLDVINCIRTYFNTDKMQFAQAINIERPCGGCFNNGFIQNGVNGGR